MTGRTFRRCGCRYPEGHEKAGKLVGTSCPRLKADGRHGTWNYAVDLPAGPDGKRKLRRRGGFATERLARAAMKEVTDRLERNIVVDDRETVTEYMGRWLQARSHTLKPRTAFNYGHQIEKNINPVIGAVKLDDLRHEHVQGLVEGMVADGRGPSVVKLTVAVLRSALGHAVKTRRLGHNPAEHVDAPAYKAPERTPWTVDQASTFIRYARGGTPWAHHREAELFITMMLTGLRRGEALALRWDDVDAEQNVIRVRRSLTEVGGRLVEGTPKTKASAGFVPLSDQLADVLAVQRIRQDMEKELAGSAYQDDGRVFAREDGTPIRPEKALDTFHAMTDVYGLPRSRVHDLRHLAASLMIAGGVPLLHVSKVLRHSSPSITGSVYGHMLPESGQGAVGVLGALLDNTDMSARNHDERTLNAREAS